MSLAKVVIYFIYVDGSSLLRAPAKTQLNDGAEGISDGTLSPFGCFSPTAVCNKMLIIEDGTHLALLEITR